MVLKLGNKGDAVKTLQRGLNKLGAILLVDGDFGPGTRDAVVDARVVLQQPGPPEADEALQAAVAHAPDIFPPLTAAGVTFIGREEVSSAQAYRRQHARPEWPGVEAGITIGIGYDLRFVDGPALKADWGDRLPAAALERLAAVTQKLGSREMAAQLADVQIPLFDAIEVFARRSLPRFLASARSIYPRIDELSAAQRSALVSLVYNRGSALDDKPDDPLQRRREMREIQTLLANEKDDAVAGQIDSMARIWDPDKAPGLIARRHREATLWRSGFAALQLD
jgi:peptidoglycan hydrolase-like protein with peptidoglycan-binding domain